MPGPEKSIGRPVFRRRHGATALPAPELRFFAVRGDAPPIRCGSRAGFLSFGVHDYPSAEASRSSRA